MPRGGADLIHWTICDCAVPVPGYGRGETQLKVVEACLHHDSACIQKKPRYPNSTTDTLDAQAFTDSQHQQQTTVSRYVCSLVRTETGKGHQI